MNLALFSRLAEREYQNVLKETPDYPYTMEEVLDIFCTFFEQYEEHRGERHPPLKRELIRKYIQLMPCKSEAEGEIAYYDVSEYHDMIEHYFSTPFKKCDYHIGHFFSGDIRVYREFEIMYE